MSNISIKINLRQLKHAVRMMKGANGDIECVVIPIVANNLFKGESAVYLDMTGFELKEKKADRKDTHLVKQALPKEVFEKMTEEQKKAAPILGNMIVWAGYQEPAPVNVEVGEAVEGEGGDLPF